MSDDKWAGIPSVESSWINTVSGKRFDILDPKEDQIDITDIARGLSNIGRYSGQTKEFYSVAEHSYLASYAIDQRDDLPLMALLHDSAEAYLGDVTSPLKALLPKYRGLETLVLRIILRKFGLPSTLPQEVEEVDRRMLATEAEVLFERNEEWLIPFKPYDNIRISPLPPDLAEFAFMERLQQLTIGSKVDFAG